MSLGRESPPPALLLSNQGSTKAAGGDKAKKQKVIPKTRERHFRKDNEKKLSSSSRINMRYEGPTRAKTVSKPRLTFARGRGKLTSPFLRSKVMGPTMSEVKANARKVRELKKAISTALEIERRLQKAKDRRVREDWLDRCWAEFRCPDLERGNGLDTPPIGLGKPMS